MRFFFPILLILSTPALAQLNAEFSVSSTQGCSPLTVRFTDNSTGLPASWFWDFGNGITSTDRNPAVTYISGGIYTVRLIVRNSTEQDYEEKTNYIKVFKTPLAGFIMNTDSGCVPLPVSFTDTTDLSGITAKSFLWNFGDGFTSALQNPTHTFTGENRFDVSLTIETTNRCTTTFEKKGAVRAGTKPTVDFTASPIDGCASVLRQFTNKSSKITSSAWDFGDKTTSKEKSPLHHFQDTGWFSVKLAAANNGCENSIIKTKYIHVKGPVAKISKAINCSNGFSIQVKDISIGAASRQWDFDDGVISNAAVENHTYSAPGNYTVQLSVNSGSCSDTAYFPVYFTQQKPLIDIAPKQSAYCKEDSIEFMFTNYDTAAAASFRWNFGNGDSLNYNSRYDTVFHVYHATGNFNVVAFLKDKNNCIDTIPLKTVIKAGGPVADFESSDPACTETKTFFYDKSINSGAPVTEWLWSYGDGNISTDTKPFSYTYAFPGKYNVHLTTTDANGCFDTITHTITIRKTPDVEAAQDTLVCAGVKITLSASGATQYSWQTNTGAICTNCVNPVVSPSSTTVYYVTGTNPSGCSAADSIVVTVQEKISVTAQPAGAEVCSGTSVQLNADGANSYTWSPAAGLNNTAVSNPVASPTANTVYTVVGKDKNNCFSDTATVTINADPLPSIDIPVNTVQLPAGSAYQIQTTASNDVLAWQWLPQTGLSCYNCPNPVATVNNTITYTAIVSNENGCSNTDSITLVTTCNNEIVFLPSSFSPNNDGLNDYFYPNSKNTITIKSLIIYNRWGQEVFEKTNFFTNNYSNGWNGKFNNHEQNTDVYVYIMQYECTDNAIITRKGTITLLR